MGDKDKVGIESIRPQSTSTPDEVVWDRMLTSGQATSPNRITKPWAKYRGFVANEANNVRVLLRVKRKGATEWEDHEVVHQGFKIEGPGLVLELVGDDICYTVTEHQNVTSSPRLNQVIDGRFINLGAPPPAPDFADVTMDEDGDDELYDAVMWARRRGIVGGYSDNTVRPNESLTRGQMLLMLYRAEGKS